MIDSFGQLLTIVFSIIFTAAFIVGIAQIIVAVIILIKKKLKSSNSDEEK